MSGTRFGTAASRCAARRLQPSHREVDRRACRAHDNDERNAPRCPSQAILSWSRRRLDRYAKLEPPELGEAVTTADKIEMPSKTNGGRDHRGQVKTRDRVRELAEVYTHEREVNAMLDLIPDMFPPGATGADIKFLEPACGSGNFLEEILRRKLRHIRFNVIRSASACEHRILRAVASIYGVDICADNVAEARDRMVSVVRTRYFNDANIIEPTEGFVSAVRAILATNIVQADFLTDGASTEVIDYQPIRGGFFKRVWSRLDGSDAAEPQPGLFQEEPGPKRDEIPVHYIDLAATPEPTRIEASTPRIPRGA